MHDLQEATDRASLLLPPGARLRQLTQDDAVGLSSIAAGLGQRQDTDYWRRKLGPSAREPGPSLGVEVDGRLAAHMLGQVRGGFGLPEETGWLELLGVDPSWQGHGLARALAEALFEQLAARDVGRVLTLVDARQDTLRPFFRSLGFRQSQLLCLERRL